MSLISTQGGCTHQPISFYLENCIKQIKNNQIELINEHEKYLEKDTLRIIGNIVFKALTFIAIFTLISSFPLTLMFTARCLLLAPISITVIFVSNFLNKKFFGCLNSNNHLQLYYDSLNAKGDSLPGKAALRRVEIIKQDLKSRMEFFDKAKIDFNFDRDLLTSHLKVLKITTLIFKSINDALIDKEEECKKSSSKALRLLEKVRREVPLAIQNNISSLLKVLNTHSIEIKSSVLQLQQNQPDFTCLKLFDHLVEQVCAN